MYCHWYFCPSHDLVAERISARTRSDGIQRCHKIWRTMFCINCGAPVLEGSTFCAKCGRRLPSEFYPAAPRTASIRTGTSNSLSASVAKDCGHFVGWFVHTSSTTKTQILLFLVCIFITGVIVKSFSTQNSPSPKQQLNTSSAVQQQTNSPAPKVIYPPEIRISDFMLQPRTKIEAVLGKPVSQADCQDTTGQQYEYSDGSYLCVDHGRVILLSYILHRIPSDGYDALDAVGLHTVVQPYAPFGTLLNVWSAERGNPLTVGKIYAHQVTAMVTQIGTAGSSAVEVDMTGVTRTNGR